MKMILYRFWEYWSSKFI